MDRALWPARAPRRELPEADVVLRRRYRLELVRELPKPGAEVVVDDQDSPLACDLADRILCRLVGDHDRGVRVVEVVRVVLRLEERVRLGGDRTDFLRSVPEGDEVDRVAQDEQHPVLRSNAELLEQVAVAVHEPRELRVGRGSVRVDQRGSVAAAFLHVAVDEPGREVQLVRKVGAGDHAATSRISSTSMSVSVSNVSRPSSAEDSAGAPQYASSMPIARKSVRPSRIAAGMSTCRSVSAAIRSACTS